MITFVKSKRYSAEEWAQFIEFWRHSGLSQVEFCRKHGIPTYLFYSWKLKGNLKKLKLLPVKSEESQPLKSLPSIKVIFPSGISCQFSDVTNMTPIINLIKGCEKCN
jgi:hypothetical protein